MFNLPIDSFEEIPLKGRLTAALWDAKKDSVHIHKHYQVLRDIRAELNYLWARKEKLAWKRLKLYKNLLVRDFETNLYRIWNDRKTGTVFPDGSRFEPHQVTIENNRVLWDGMALFAEQITGEVNSRITDMVAGIGVSDTTLDQPILENEKARADIIRDGDANADGNTMKWSAPFATGIPSNDFSEFGGSDSDNEIDGILAWRVVIQEAENKLKHTQNVTLMQASHTIALVSISDKIA